MHYLAYDYAGHIGQAASTTMALPVDELLGYQVFKKLQAELIEDGR